MRIRRTGHRDAEAMERLLDTAGRDAGGDPVARLLAAAAAPPRPGELAGEDQAVAAFRQAARVPGRAEPARRWRRRLTAGAAAWAAVGATTVTAGVALAAGTHVFIDDGPASRPSTAPASAPGPGGTSAGVTPSGGTRSPGASGTGPGTLTPGSTASGAAPSMPEITGLCTAYLHKDPKQREKALRTPSYQRLVTAAGGAARVEAYCTGLAASPSGAQPTVPPGQAKKPTPKAKATPGPKPTKPHEDPESKKARSIGPATEDD
jgi:hypothetical protein